MLDIEKKSDVDTSKVGLSPEEQAQKMLEEDPSAAIDIVQQKAAKKKKQESNKSLEDLLRFYIGPIVMLVVSLGLVFGLILPLGQDILTGIGEINELQEEFSDLENQLDQRQSLANITNEQQQQIALIDRLIPTSNTEVVDFSQDIRRVAAVNQLTLDAANLRETRVVKSAALQQGNVSIDLTTDTTAEDIVSLDLIQIPADFSLQGGFDQIQSFLESFYGGDEFIIVSTLDLSKSGRPSFELTGEQSEAALSLGDWNVEVVLAKYQFRLSSGATVADTNAYYFSQAPDGSLPNGEVITFLQENYSPEVGGGANPATGN